MHSEAPLGGWHNVLVRLRLMAQPSIVRKALRAAGVVGAVLIALHHGDELVSGHLRQRALIQALLTPLIPFCVTLLGAFLQSRPTVPAAALRPGWAVVRRSLGIALGVGSAISLLNHGEVLLAGTMPPGVMMKILVTPCVPFCVSWYGAYAAYRQALAAEQQPRERLSRDSTREG